MKKKILSILIILFVILSLTACGKQKNYNYNRLNVKTIVDYNHINESFDEVNQTVYFKSIENSNSYLYIIKETEKEEYSLDTASKYLLTFKDILKQGYQMSKKEVATSKKIGNQFVCTYTYSALDKSDNIYEVKTKYIYDTKTKEALMLIAFIDDKEESNAKEAFLQIYNETVLKTDEELK